ncbi:non-ribosomal peptide synthetase [Nitrosococcus oceani]|uniref:non-ribosomal peptide synthetase family protein n=1 Tax=Nitrosococcus oceani TaxID=1229 RepID=UPI0005632CF9|nr:non-ribosomal peptide synthetase [Nitrosococcus oceani]
MHDLSARIANLSAEKRALLMARLKQSVEPRLPRIPRRPRQAVAPLSFAQERLWFLAQLEPASSFYNNAGAIKLQGKLDRDALEQSLRAIVRRHEVLRTAFTVYESQPQQAVADEASVVIEKVDLREWFGKEQTERVQEQMMKKAQQPFDLTVCPLFRATLLVLGAEEHILLLVMHHIISDGWSVGVLIREFVVLYESFRAGRLSPLPELPVQYADYAVWQREWLQGKVIEEQLSYWKEQLQGSLAVLELPADRLRPAVQSHRGAAYCFTISSVIAERLKALGRREGVTLFMVLLAAFKVLLWRYSGQQNLCVGTPIANRKRVELEDLIGFFVNTLVLRTDLSGNPPFIELLRRVREVCLGAQAHQDLPFEKLVEQIAPVRDMSHSPLFQVMFVLQNAPETVLEIQGLKITPLEVDICSAKLDLTLSITERENGLEAWFEYSTDLFNASTIARMAGHYGALLEDILAKPNALLSDLEFLPETERHQLLVEWNATKSEYPQDKCLHEFFEMQVEKTPEEAALIYKNQFLTYSELNAQANRLGHHLQKLGVGPGVLVAICVERSLEMVVGILGILKAGGAYVPIEPSYPQERKASLLADSAPRVVLTQARWMADLPLGDIKCVCLDRDWETIVQYPASTPANKNTPRNVAYVIYTSGSTGKPKGVEITHRNAAHSTWARFDYYQKPVGRFLLLSSFAFDSSVAGIFWTLSQGGCLCLPEEGHQCDPLLLEKEIVKKSVTHLLCLPSFYQLLLEQGGPRLGSLQVVVVAGESCPPGLVNRHYKALPHVALFNEYGPTEGTVWSTVYRCKDEHGERISIGRPIANACVYVLDQCLQPVPIGITGELYIGGMGLARGYLNRPELTAERFVPDPFAKEAGNRLYRTGDLARYKPDGKIEYLGRIDHQIKIRGYRIELGEVEAVLLRHPQVKEAVAVAREDIPGGNRLVAYVVGKGPMPTAGELRAHLKEVLPEYMVPAAFMFLESLPLTSNGKVDRAMLPVPDVEAQFAHQYVAPRTATEKILAKIWAQVLGVEQVGIQDNFFDLGGYSMLAVRLTFRIREAFGVDMPLRVLFERPTIEAQARLINSDQPFKTSSEALVEWETEAELDPDIIPCSTDMPEVISPVAVLLTGATGFLGAFLLRELLRETNATIYCLVRGNCSQEAAARLRQVLDRYELHSIAENPRIIPLQGDLSQPLLGISPDHFEKLSWEIDAIYHNGAAVDFTASYEVLKPSNVLGTQEVLRLACLGKSKAVHYVSTVSVFGEHSPFQPSGFTEEDFPPGDEKLIGGYTQSKWVAERMVRGAAERGVSVTIHRPSTIIGDSRSGVWNTGDFLCRMIKGCIEMGSAPELDEPLNLVPVDYVSKAIVFLSSRPDFLGRTFHLTSRKTISSKTLLNQVREFGYLLRSFPVGRWVRDIAMQIKHRPDHVFYPLLPLFEDWQRDNDDLSDAVNRYGCLNTIEALRDGNLDYPQEMEKSIRVVLTHLIRSGFIPIPETGNRLTPL